MTFHAVLIDLKYKFNVENIAQYKIVKDKPKKGFTKLINKGLNLFQAVVDTTTNKSAFKHKKNPYELFKKSKPTCESFEEFLYHLT